MKIPQTASDYVFGMTGALKGGVAAAQLRGQRRCCERVGGGGGTAPRRGRTVSLMSQRGSPPGITARERNDMLMSYRGNEMTEISYVNAFYFPLTRKNNLFMLTICISILKKIVFTY